MVLGMKRVKIEQDRRTVPLSANYRTHKIINEMDIVPIGVTEDRADVGTHQPQGVKKQSPSSDIIILLQGMDVKGQFAQGRDPFAQAIVNSLRGSTSDSTTGQFYRGDDPFIRILLGQEEPTPDSRSVQPAQSDDTPIQAMQSREKALTQSETLEEKSSSQMDASDGIMAEVRDSMKGGKVHGEEKEDRPRFISRLSDKGFTVHEGKNIAYGYREAGDIHIQGTTGGQIREELKALGLDAIIMDGTVLVNVRDISYEQFIPEAAAISGEAIFINNGVTGNPRNVAGHEAYHFWKGTKAREAYVEVIRDNLDFKEDAHGDHGDFRTETGASDGQY